MNNSRERRLHDKWKSKEQNRLEQMAAKRYREPKKRMYEQLFKEVDDGK